MRGGSAGIIDLSARSRILVNGSEAGQFLNGLITNDMKTLAEHTWMPAIFPNVQGRLLAAVRVINRGDGFLIDTESTTRETVVKLLDRFTMAGDFRVADLTEETACLSVQGRQAEAIVRCVFNALPERQKIVAAHVENDVTIIRATHTAEDGFDLICNAGDAARIQALLMDAGAELVTDNVVETLRIEAGIPRFGIDMDETTVVTETNLDDAVSFTKGCYLGQEIIIRIKHRGHVAKKLTGVSFAGRIHLERDARLTTVDEREIGRVTSSTYSPILDRTVALAYVKYEYVEPGTEVKTGSGESQLFGKVDELPFVRGSWSQN